MELVTSEGIIVTNRIFVGSIPDWMCENKLHLAFQDMNYDVQDTRIVLDMRTGERKGYGFVTFNNPDDAMKLVKKGSIVTKDGVRLKLDTAVRRKGLQLRLQKQMLQGASNQPSATVHNIYPAVNQVPTQVNYVYPANVKLYWSQQPGMSSTGPTYYQQQGTPSVPMLSSLPVNNLAGQYEHY